MTDGRPRILVVSTAASDVMSGEPPIVSPDAELEWVSPFVVTPRFAETKAVIPRLPQFRTIAFTSGHAVDAIVGAIRALGHDVRLLAGIRLAVVGRGTAARLDRYGLSADLVADGGGAELAREILAADLPDPVLCPRARDARVELIEALTAAGRRTEAPLVYETQPDEVALVAARRRHAAQPYAAIAFCSPRGATALIEAFGGAARLEGLVLGAIGETTRAALAEQGLEGALVPERPSIEALVSLLATRVGGARSG